MGKAMSRLGGGIGTRGPGESKLESDRRHIRSRIDKLRRDLEQVRQVRAVQRRQRKKTELPMVAIRRLHERGQVYAAQHADRRRYRGE